jgi:hypothetical protein
MRFRMPLALVLAGAFVFALACDGDDPTATSTAAPSTATAAAPAVSDGAAGATATSTAPAATTTATPAQASTEEPSAEESPAGSGGALAALSPLEQVDSFRLALSASFEAEGDATPSAGIDSGALTMTGAFVAPDRMSIDVKLDMEALPLDIKTVRIGDTMYTNLNGTWQTSDATDDTLFGQLLPLDQEFFEDLPFGDLEALGDFTTEERNGMQVKHYSLDQEEIARLALESGESEVVEELLEANDLAVDLYIRDPDGYLVGLSFSGVVETNELARLAGGSSGPAEEQRLRFQLTMDITNIDDPSIVIEPPV